jgi:hypothetical protein
MIAFGVRNRKGFDSRSCIARDRLTQHGESNVASRNRQ